MAEGNVSYKYTDPPPEVINMAHHTPDLESFLVEVYNRGFLSGEFHAIKPFRDSHAWQAYPSVTVSLVTVNYVVSILRVREERNLDIDDGNPYLTGIKEFIYLLCHNDLIVTMDMDRKGHFTTTKSLLILESLQKTSAGFINVFHSALRELYEGVIELKRLCRRYLRVYLSTEYGKTRSPFDLREICRQLPVAKVTQDYLMIHPNGMFERENIEQKCKYLINTKLF